MQQIQLTNEQAKELETMTRLITEADQNELNRAYAELDKKGFVFSGENFIKLIRAYNSAPQSPITVKSVLDYTKTYRDAFEWLSAEQVEYNNLSAQIGPEQTALVTRELGRHGLINTAGTEELFNNFNQVVRFYRTKRWTISSDSFEKAIGNLRTSLQHGSLYWKPTPEDIARQKHWDETRASESKKSLLEIAKAKAATVAHIRTPEGRRLSDVIMEEFYKNHPEAVEAEAPPVKTPQQDIADAAEAHWEQETKSYIRSLTGQNLLQQDAQRLFGQPLHGSWRQAYASLQIWHERKKLGVWGQS